MPGQLTTHILDTAAGQPARGITVELHRLGDGKPEFLVRAVTNDDGRTAGPLLAGDALRPGLYEITFQVGAYFPGGFFESIPVRFRVADASAHYHVPLLCSPWAYSTYRGS